MIRFYASEYRDKVKNLIVLLLPMIASELSIFGMNFFDASMSGQAGPVELAGTAMAGNIWMALNAGMGTALMAGTPIISQLFGAKKFDEISKVVQQGLFIATFFALIVIFLFIFATPPFYDYLQLESDVKYVSVWYGIMICIGVLPFFWISPLRSLLDSMGYEDYTMKTFLSIIPFHVVMNYIFIFGLGFIPAFGGIGTGISTAITYWLLFLLFALRILFSPGLKDFHIFHNICFSFQQFWEFLRVGVPAGFAYFLEYGSFAMTSFLIAKFGTNFIAADMAATNFCAITYIIPRSISLAATVLVGKAVGAKNSNEAHDYAVLALQISLVAVLVYATLEFITVDWIARIYTADKVVKAIIVNFMFYGITWQFFDAVGAPLQGILRGYKDVNIPFLISVVAFWGICLPYGIFMDYVLGREAYCYWEGINISLLASSLALFCRLKYREKQEL